MNEEFVRYCSNYKRKKATSNELAKFIMLCGKAIEVGADDNRAITKKILNEKRNDVYPIYSEDIFSIVGAEQKVDLLKFEELLVEISDGVILFLESYGTATELGAFTYLDNLARKTLVFADSRFEHDASFINSGPLSRIKLLTNESDNLGGVIFTRFLENDNIDFGTKGNYTKIVTFSNKKTVSLDKNNFEINAKRKKVFIRPQLLMHFLIDLVFVFDFVPQNEVYSLLNNLLNVNKYDYVIKVESNNKFDPKTIQQYIIDMLIKWEIFRVTQSSRTYENILSINFGTLTHKKDIIESFGKVLFTSDMFRDRKYMNYKARNIRYNRNQYGDVYGK